MTIEQHMAWLAAQLPAPGAAPANAAGLLAQHSTRERGGCFVALLELAKRGALTLAQLEPFSPLWVAAVGPEET